MDKLDHLKTIYKNMTESVRKADNVRSLFKESSNDLQKALIDVSKVLKDDPYVLIGGLAIGCHIKPRGTDDVDILLPTEELDNVHRKLQQSNLFKKSREHASIHKDTGVEIELLTAPYIKVPSYMVDTAIQTRESRTLGSSIVHIVTAKMLLVLKLDRFSKQDQADIESLIKAGVTDVSDVVKEKLYLDRFDSIKNTI